MKTLYARSISSTATPRRSSVSAAGLSRLTSVRSCRVHARSRGPHYAKADRIRVVLDNLSTHTAGSLYVAFVPDEARRIHRKLEFHYTPTHASWLKMVEIEIGVMVSQCLDRRIATKEILVAEIKAWERARNRDGARIVAVQSSTSATAALGIAAEPTRCRPSFFGQTAGAGARGTAHDVRHSPLT